MSSRDGVDPAAGTDAIPAFEHGIGLHRELELVVEAASAPLKRSPPPRHLYHGIRRKTLPKGSTQGGRDIGFTNQERSTT